MTSVEFLVLSFELMSSLRSQPIQYEKVHIAHTPTKNSKLKTQNF
jgi:hypothetical protein